MFSDMEGFNETYMTDDDGVFGLSVQSLNITQVSSVSSTSVPVYTPIDVSVNTTDVSATTTNVPTAPVDAPAPTITDSPSITLTKTEAALELTYT